MGENVNVKNRTMFTDRRGFFTRAGKGRKKEDREKVVDNLLFLRGINSECVDLIYLDPPFNSKDKYNQPLENGKLAIFDDTWRMDMVKDEWQKKIAIVNPPLAQLLETAKLSGHHSDQPYLIYMAIRLMEMRRVLKPTGGIYLHCDPTMSHWLKLLMDRIFGVKNFRNEIIWGYEKPRPAAKIWRRNHDVIFFYSKGAEYTFNVQRVATLKGEFKLRKPFKRPDGTVWKPEEPGKQAGSWWPDIPSFATRMTAPEKTGYPTQKPVALLERIIKASSNEGDLVLDPFCGCATACIAAEKLGRKWIGMDVSPVAFDMIKTRLAKELKITVKTGRTHGEQEILRLQQKRADGKIDKWEAHHRTIPPHRGDGVLLDIKGKDRIAVREKLFNIQDGLCNGCAQRFGKANFAIDHITPKLFGGLELPTNLQLLCAGCNSAKGVKTMDEFTAARRAKSLPCREIPESEYREKLEWETDLEKPRETA
ncbi:MAG: DNA methyltransferase [Gammaproteobacteria bacterium]